MGKERSVLLLGSFTLFWLCFLTFPIKYCCFAVYGSGAVYEKGSEEGKRSWNNDRIRPRIGTGLNHRHRRTDPGTPLPDTRAGTSRRWSAIETTTPHACDFIFYRFGRRRRARRRGCSLTSALDGTSTTLVVAQTIIVRSGSEYAHSRSRISRSTP